MAKCRLSTFPGKECANAKPCVVYDSACSIINYSLDDPAIEVCPCPSKMKPPAPSVRLSEAIAEKIEAKGVVYRNDTIPIITAVLARYGVEDKEVG